MISVRHADRDDLPAVQSVLVTTWHATYDAIYGAERVAEITKSWHALEALEWQLDLPDFVRLIAVEDGQIVGTASGALVADGELKLFQLYVLPSAQRLGVGLKLLNRLIGDFDGATHVTLEVEPANASAVDFYRRNGFVEAGTVADCGRPGSGIPAIVMRRDLARAQDAEL
ncbi:MAG: GNAT family N-acetyltransferase [Pseudomonadota bacterium]